MSARTLPASWQVIDGGRSAPDRSVAQTLKLQRVILRAISELEYITSAEAAELVGFVGHRGRQRARGVLLALEGRGELISTLHLRWRNMNERRWHVRKRKECPT